MNALPIRHLQHIGIPVTSIDRSIRFYHNLGFVNSMMSTFDRPGGKGHVAMMKMGDITIELYEMPADELEEVKLRKHGHVDHIAFDVANIDEVFGDCLKRGLAIQEPAPVLLPRFWDSGCKYFNIVGPDGEKLEFNQIL